MMCRMTPSPPRALRTAVAATLVLAVLAGCAWRLETPPIPQRTPTPEVVLRDEAAVREEAVTRARGAGLLAEIQEAAAPVRLDVLGGVYVATPSPTATPEPSATVPPELDEATEAARDGALEAAAAADGSDASLAFLLRSIALSHALALGVEAAGDGEPGDRTMPSAVDVGDALLPEDGTSLDADVIAGLAVEHDRAAFAYEVGAARAAGDERARALERARQHRARADALVELPGVEDLRAELYDVAPASIATRKARAATALELETGIGWNYAALLDGATADDAAWLLNAAYDAYCDAASLSAFTAADVPALPGLERADG